ncbi:formate dehydrogenase subunit alpha [Salaquimonas pukyongi]|uniref:formate dehydrogenase subunit alpha n=1 Tax=Salaquimonas pukyongi TaxID=2712698 RepID=UPI00096BCFAC|nr:formate dehydrogenase subunit alpha [Salaquimonas pukyongi]
MTNSIKFTLDGKEVEAAPGETIWQVAKREGTRIPHLCYLDEPGYRADGNCRACMVEIEGERVLAASCQRKVSQGLMVRTDSERADKSRRMVFELLAADMGPPQDTPDDQSVFWQWAKTWGISGNGRLGSKFDSPHAEPVEGRGEDALHDISNPAIAVNLDACIACGLCVRACREVQVNDVIGMGGRGSHAAPVFDLADPMGASTCVTCGECVQACPTGALYEKSLMDEANKRRVIGSFDETVNTVCPYCGVGCQIEVNVKDGKIVQVDGRDGPANENRLCVKGRFGFDYVSHPDRLTVPLIRREDAPKKWDVSLDRSNMMEVFREATWEEAMELAASGLKKIHAEKGGSALAGFGSAKCSNEEAYLFQKLIRQGFGTNNVDHCTRLCHASSVAALMEGVNSGAVTAPFTAAEDADCIIVIGARPAQNHPVAATYLKQAAKRGAKLILMDPRGQNLGRYAAYELNFKPGRDVSLLNAMLHVIMEEELYDRQYVQANTLGFEDLKESVKRFPPEEMEKVCGIPAETIREVARLYATSQRSIIFWGMGVSQHVHGTDNARCLIALALATGHVGRPGTGLHPLRGQNNVQGASDAGLIPMVYPDYKSVEDASVRDRYQEFWGTELDPKKGLTVVEIINAILDGEISGMYIMGENPAMSDPDQKHARMALAKLDHLVVQDIFLTETAWHADVVLPASAHAEKAGTYSNTNRQVQMGRPVLDPPGQARQDWELLVELARRIGLDWNYNHPSDVFAEMAQVMPSLANITWERLEREDAVTYPCEAPDKPGNAIIFTDGFPTETGRAKIVPTDLVPPAELPDADYPFVLTTGRLLEHWHTGAMTRRASTLDAIEPEPVAGLNRWDMKRMELAPGDPITVETRRGAITLTARQDPDVAEGMVFIPFCFVEAAANVLTNPQLDPMGKIPEFKFCAARVMPGQTRQAAE